MHSNCAIACYTFTHVQVPITLTVEIINIVCFVIISIVHSTMKFASLMFNDQIKFSFDSILIISNNFSLLKSIETFINFFLILFEKYFRNNVDLIKKLIFDSNGNFTDKLYVFNVNVILPSILIIFAYQ